MNMELAMLRLLVASSGLSKKALLDEFRNLLRDYQEHLRSCREEIADLTNMTAINGEPL